MRPLRVAYLGNFKFSFCTETHVAGSLESLGHTVLRIQEGHPKDDGVLAYDIPAMVRDFGADIFLHTQTYGLATSSGSHDERTRCRDDIRAMGIPTVFLHLDLWFGLDRADQLTDNPEPWVGYDYIFTADGGHQDQWTAIGANHIWSPPGVYHAEAYDGRPNPRYRADVAFVGFWQAYGHVEHRPYRSELISRLRGWYGRRFRAFPEQRGAIRGDALNNLYASVRVVVGDSCGVASGITHYCSDRIPETTGRGGFLIHPHVEGVTGPDGVFPHVPTWPAGDWDALHALIERYLHDHAARQAARDAMVADTRTRHTYRDRLSRILDIVMARAETTTAVTTSGGIIIDGASDLGSTLTTS